MTRLTGQPQMVEAAAAQPGQRTDEALIAELAHHRPYPHFATVCANCEADWPCAPSRAAAALAAVPDTAEQAQPDEAAPTQPDVAETIAREIEAEGFDLDRSQGEYQAGQRSGLLRAARIARSAAARTQPVRLGSAQPVTHDEAAVQPETRQDTT